MRGLLLHEELENWQNLVDPFWLSTVRKFRYYPFNDDRTWHKDIKTLPPGTMACIDEEGGESWQRPFGPIIPRKGIAQLDPNITLNKICSARELRHLLIEAIRTRIDLSDVPVSILLSGGLDSSIIYTVANNILGKNVTTFTIDNAEDQKYVSLLNPKNLRFLDFDDTPLETILRANEGPVDLGSMTAQYLIGQAIRKEGFDVALSGDGADELFGGYRRINKYDSQQSDVWSELVNYHLPRLDKMMMQHTVELRSPYLARPVVEFALALPYQWRINKNLLKMAFEDDLPEEIINRPKEPLKIEGVRNNKEDHTLKMVDEWLSLERPI